MLFYPYDAELRLEDFLVITVNTALVEGLALII